MPESLSQFSFFFLRKQVLRAGFKINFSVVIGFLLIPTLSICVKTLQIVIAIELERLRCYTEEVSGTQTLQKRTRFLEQSC